MLRFIQRVSALRRVLLAVAGAAAATAASATGAQAADGGASSGQLQVETVCFTVYNAGDQFATTLYGLRYSDGRQTSQTPAIVLVHGYASSTGNWDFTPNWSVARKLAQQGYVVISYDRPGFARSPYAGDPTRLGRFYQRDVLHQVVMEVRYGTYLLPNQDSCAPSVPKAQSTLASPEVVIVGHSQGGGIVQGYPGAYHDVAAMIQTDIGGPMIEAPPNPIPTPPAPPTFPPDPRVPVPPPGYAQFFNNRQACEAFNVNWRGAVQEAVDIACDPTQFVYSPNPTVDPPGAPTQEDLIRQTGPIPVLLSWGDSDVIAPIYNDELHYQFWLQNCRCDVSRLYLPDTGHLFQVHKSLDLWVSWVTTWLSDRGLRPTPAVASAPAPTVTQLGPAGPTEGTVPAEPKAVVPDAARKALDRTAKAKRCVVPRLRGLTVAAATARLAKSNCELGRSRARDARGSRPGRVISQSRRPSTRLRAGTPINLVIARRSRSS
jgi:pimeloyl-ACP methyl ester carboxylesterase